MTKAPVVLKKQRSTTPLARWALACGVCGSLIASVVWLGERDSADPARCGVLVATGGRCCAEGQHVEGGACRGRPTRCPEPMVVDSSGAGCVRRNERVRIAGGTLHIGPMDWEAQGRVTPRQVHVAPFALDALEISEGEWGECVASGACPARATAGEPGRAVAGISYEEASAYCRFRGGRLPTSDEWTWASGGAKGRRYPWGDTGAVCRRGAWGLSDGPCGRGGTGPEWVGSHPDGASPEGIFDLAGNVAEWVDDPEEGSRASGKAGVRGGSWATSFAAELRSWHVRPLERDERAPDVGARCAYDERAQEAAVGLDRAAGLLGE